MAAVGPAAPLRYLPLLHILLVVVGYGHPGKALSLQSEVEVFAVDSSNNKTEDFLCSKDDLDVVVTLQVLAMQFMEDTLNTSFAAQTAAWTERQAWLGETLRLHEERMEAGQQRRTQEVLDAITTGINTATQDILTRVAESRQEDRQELLRSIREQDFVREVPEAEETPASCVSGLHNDTQPSICLGNKVLVGSVGSLVAVKSGVYPHGLDCSWNIRLPAKAPLRLEWEFINIESHSQCRYDWMKVHDVSNGHTLYGGRLCGTFRHSNLRALNKVLPPTQNIRVIFHSDTSNPLLFGGYNGFRLNYAMVDH